MIAPNTVLQDRYVVLEQIGQGGMGAVYVATDRRFGSTVALKETFFDDPALRRAFEREAHLLNRLRHPALPRVSDHFSEGAGQFLVMEFIPGDDLADMLEKRGGAAFPLEQVLLWADQLLDALDYLHTHEPPVVHRDIKPQNLKLTSRNQIVLLDFGLAKGTPAAVSRASVTGSVFGYSRNYAPLEQMQGTGTDPRSDIYSLAATLYHLLTGAIPPDALTRAMSAVNEQPDPLRPADEVHAQVTRSVAAALSKAMRQSSAQRYQTAEEMRGALRDAARRVGEERAAATVPTPPPGAAGPGDSPTATPAGLQDQETRLLGGRTNARADQATRAAEADRATAYLLGTQAASGPDAATLLGPGLTAAPGSAPTPSAPVPSATAHADDSVVTRVHSTQSTHVAGRRGLSGRALGAAAGVLALLVAAGAFYAFTRREEAPRTPTPERQQRAQQAGATPEPQPSAQTAVESAPPAPQTAAPSPAPASEAAPAHARQAPAPAAKGVKRAEGGRDAVTLIDETRIEEQVREAERHALRGVVVPEVKIPENLEGMSPEERERLRNMPRRLRQIMLQQRRVQRQRQRALEEAERQRRHQHPSPPQVPPP